MNFNALNWNSKKWNNLETETWVFWKVVTFCLPSVNFSSSSQFMRDNATYNIVKWTVNWVNFRKHSNRRNRRYFLKQDFPLKMTKAIAFYYVACLSSNNDDKKDAARLKLASQFCIFFSRFSLLISYSADKIKCKEKVKRILKKAFVKFATIEDDGKKSIGSSLNFQKSFCAMHKLKAWSDLKGIKCWIANARIIP